MINHPQTMSSWLFFKTESLFGKSKFFVPEYLLGLGISHSITTIERLSLGGVSFLGHALPKNSALRRFNAYTEALHDESYETHMKILKVFEKIVKNPQVEDQKNYASYLELLKKCDPRAHQGIHPAEIKRGFQEFFSACSEDEAIKLFHFDSFGQLNLCHFFSDTIDVEEVELKDHFMSSCIDYSLRSFSFFKGLLFFIFRRQTQDSVPRLIGLNLKDQFSSKLHIYMKRRFWMDDILNLYPSSVQGVFQDQFANFVLDATGYDPKICLRAVSNPISFFNPRDLGRWILDPGCSKYDLANIFSTYLQDPSLHTSFITSLTELDLAKKTHLLDVLQLVKILQPIDYKNAYLDEGGVLAYFLAHSKLEEVRVWVSHIVLLASKELDLGGKTLMEDLCYLFSRKLVWDTKRDLVQFKRKASKAHEISVIEYLISKMGYSFIETLVEIWKKAHLHPFFLKRFILAVFKSRSYPFLLKNFFDRRAFQFDVNLANSDSLLFECSNHPLMLALKNEDARLESKIIDYLLFEEFPFFTFEDDYAFDSFSLLLSIFSSDHSFKALGTKDQEETLGGYYLLGNPSQMEVYKRHLVKSAIKNEKMFVDGFRKFLNKALRLINRFTPFAKDFKHTSYEVRNIKWLLGYLKDEPILAEITSVSHEIFDAFLHDDSLQPYEVRLISVIKDCLVLKDDSQAMIFPPFDVIPRYLERLALISQKPSGIDKFEALLLANTSFEASVKTNFPFLSLEHIAYFEGIIFIFFEKLISKDLTVASLIELAQTFEKCLAYAFDGLDESDELKKLFGFQNFLTWMLNDVIEKEHVPENFSNKAEILKALSDSKFQNPSLNYLGDFFRFLLKFSDLKKLGRSSFSISEVTNQELDSLQTEQIEMKGRLIDKLEIFSRRFFEGSGHLLCSHMRAGDLAGFMQELKNIAPAFPELIHPFYAFAGVDDSYNFDRLKIAVKQTFQRFSSDLDEISEDLLERLVALTDRVKVTIHAFDPLGLEQLLVVFDRIKFLEIEEPTEEIDGPFAVSSTFLDDTGVPFSPAILRENFCRLLDRVSSRRQILAVPSFRKGRHVYYQELETKLFFLKNLLMDALVQEDKIKLVGPLLCNLAIAAAHCATRWVMEVDGAIDALKPNSQEHTWETRFLMNLEQVRKKTTMNMIEVLFEEEKNLYGVEALIHPFNYIRSKYSKRLGLQKATEGLFDAELMEDLEQKIEEFDFFAQIESGVLKQVFKIIFHKETDFQYLASMDDSLSAYSFSTYRLKKWHDLFDLDLPEFSSFRSDVYQIVSNSKSVIEDALESDLTPQALQETAILEKALEVFHASQFQLALDKKRLLSSRVLTCIYESCHEIEFSEAISKELASEGSLSFSESTLQEFFHLLGQDLTSEDKEVFYENLKSDHLLKSKFLAWIKKRPRESFEDFHEAYFKSIMTTLAKLVSESDEIKRAFHDSLAQVNLTLRSIHSNKAKLAFMLDGLMQRKMEESKEELFRDYIIQSQSKDLISFFHASGLTTFNNQEARVLLESFLRQKGHKKGRFINRSILGAFERFHREQFNLEVSSRPTLRYVLMMKKLKDEKFIQYE